MTHLAPAIARLLDHPEPERRLGPFVLVEPLGRGGFAPVWLAREVYGDAVLRTAAVKLFSLDPALDDDLRGDEGAARRRIVEEARALCRVEHPSVVRFYALPIDEARGLMGLAMEYVAGTPLDARLAQAGRLPVAETLAVGVAIASALSAVHHAGLVHRDVKPSNVVEAAGLYKLIDFGIATPPPAGPGPKRGLRPLRAPSGGRYPGEREQEGARRGASPEEETLRAATGPSLDGDEELDGEEGVAPCTDDGNQGNDGAPPAQDPAQTVRIAGVLSGTVGYIDPVCFAAGAPASPASDLYALGAMLFECLTGKVPAEALAGALRTGVLTGRTRPPPLASLAADAPAELAELIDSLVAPDRRDRPRSAEWVAIRLEQIRRQLAGRARALPSEALGPFRGLGRFEDRDRDVFFGRTSEVAAALEVLRSRGLLALVGPSGSGKSSLARAGVLPAITEGALGGWPARWDAVVVEPGRDPRAALAGALAPLFNDGRDARDLAEQSPEAVVAALAERAQASGRGTALLVDQLEELATVADEEGRAWAAELTGRLGEQALPGVRAVVAARRDLLDPLLGLGALGKALARGLLLVEPVSALGWSEIVDQALSAYGYAFEDEALREEVLADLGPAAGAMPLVQFALAALWEKRDARAKRITRAGLRAIGGIAGALERHAEATLLELEEARPDAPEAARQVLLALTTAEGTRAARRLAELTAAAGPEAEGVVKALVEARLVVPGEDGFALAHEALLAQWGRLRGWVAEAREARLCAEELERDAGRWRSDPEGVPLWRRRRLAFAEELRRQGALRASEDAAAFLRASRRAERGVRVALFGAAAVAALSLLGGGAVYVRAVRAEEAAIRAALAREQEDRRVTEEQNRRLEDAQETINALIDELNREELDARKRELLQQIHEVQARVLPGARAEAPQRVSAAPQRRPPPPGEARPPADPPAPPAAAPPAAGPPPPQPSAAAPARPLDPVKDW
uniref:Protein kinase n=1 Tax=Jahnella sp. MSr9139 TaxID=1434086 RepID=A0A4Y5T162_9BACT|nr:protein kinase [Jahnella sp. MSr9139]